MWQVWRGQAGRETLDQLHSTKYTRASLLWYLRDLYLLYITAQHASIREGGSLSDSVFIHKHYIIINLCPQWGKSVRLRWCYFISWEADLLLERVAYCFAIRPAGVLTCWSPATGHTPTAFTQLSHVVAQVGRGVWGWQRVHTIHGLYMWKHSASSVRRHGPFWRWGAGEVWGHKAWGSAAAWWTGGWCVGCGHVCGQVVTLIFDPQTLKFQQQTNTPPTVTFVSVVQVFPSMERLAARLCNCQVKPAMAVTVWVGQPSYLHSKKHNRFSRGVSQLSWAF